MPYSDKSKGRGLFCARSLWFWQVHCMRESSVVTDSHLKDAVTLQAFQSSVEEIEGLVRTILKNLEAGASFQETIDFAALKIAKAFARAHAAAFSKVKCWQTAIEILILHQIYV